MKNRSLSKAEENTPLLMVVSEDINQMYFLCSNYLQFHAITSIIADN